jgi:hypothetical protein
MNRMAIVWAAIAASAVGVAACNDVGNCPAPSAIVPGGSCSGDNLECPFTLETPSPACDGTTVEGGLPTSCTCQGGHWSCPSPVSCDAEAPDGSTFDDGSSDGDATPDASLDGSGSG